MRIEHVDDSDSENGDEDEKTEIAAAAVGSQVENKKKSITCFKCGKRGVAPVNVEEVTVITITTMAILIIIIIIATSLRVNVIIVEKQDTEKLTVGR